MHFCAAKLTAITIMSPLTNKNVISWVQVLAIIILCFATRLPQILSSNFILDSDECIVALMAKHLYQGKELGVFFTGQSYGFSLVESAIISLYYALFGMNDYSVKLAILSMWTVGVVFFYKALLRLSPNQWLAFLITLVFVFSPAWSVWSMKARGGYLTAFALSSVVLYLSFRHETITKTFAWFWIGVLFVVIFYSQPLWIPGLAAIVGYQFWQHKSVKKLLSFTAGALPLLLVFLFIKHHTFDYWKPEVFKISVSALKNVVNIPWLLYDHLHGYYYLEDVYKASLSSKIYACAFIVLMVVVPVVVFYQFVFLKMRDGLFIYIMIAVLFTLGYTVFLTSHAPRYMLPLTGFVLLAVYLLLDKNKGYLLKVVVYVPFIVIGAISLVGFKDYTFEPYTKQQLLGCIDVLKQHKAYRVFSNDGLLEWQVMYYSDEQIICRETDNVDRVPAYVKLVNEAYKTDCAHTATIDFYGDLKDMEPDKTIMANQKFAIVLCPGIQLLKDMEFQF